MPAAACHFSDCLARSSTTPDHNPRSMTGLLFLGCRLIPAAPRASACQSWQVQGPCSRHAAGLASLSRSLSGRSRQGQGQGLSCRATEAGGGSRDSERFHEEMRRLATPYRGVSWNRRAKKFLASITVEGRSNYLGLFHKPEEAAEAVREARQEYPLQNRERQAQVGTPADWESEEWHLERAREAAQHLGVSWKRERRKFMATIGTSQGKLQHLGYFQTAAEAGAAYAEARSKNPYVLPPARVQSQYTGVTWHSRDECWYACQAWKGSTYFLGYHDDEHNAARAVRVFLDTHCGGKRNPRGVYLEEGDEAA